MPPIKIAPSILSADFGKLNEDIKTIEEYSDMIHVDVMDGHFVPNITIGAPVVKKIKSKLPLDCHLMIEHPWKYIKDFAEAGADIITVHQECCPRKGLECDKHKNPDIEDLKQDLKNLAVYPNLKMMVKIIKAFDVKAGVTIKPDTRVEVLREILDHFDMVLIRSVNPGFGAQSFMPEVLNKVRAIREIKPDLDIQIDGGIDDETCKLAKEAGANVLVAGSYIFGAEDRKEAILKLRNN